MGLARLYTTRHPTAPYLVLYSDPTRMQKAGKSTRARRVPKRFAVLADAQAYLADLNRRLQVVGTSGIVFDHQLKSDALAARQELDGAGFETLSLLELARDHTRRAPAQRAVMKNAEDALQEFLEKKRYEENRSEQTVEDLEKRLQKWFKQCAIVSVAQITREAVLKLRARRQADNRPVSARSRQNDLSAAHGFCGYLVSEGLLPLNPLSTVEWPTVPRKRPVAWDPDEAEDFLRAAQAYRGGALVPAVVARVFAGIRPSEMVDSRVILGVDKPRVRAEGGKLRGRANRIVPLADNAIAWLKAYPPADDGGLPYVSARAWQELRRATVALRKGKPLRWVADIARHTFISHRLVVLPDENAVAREAGNSPDEIWSSYHDLKTPEQAAAFWGIRP